METSKDRNKRIEKRIEKKEKERKEEEKGNVGTISQWDCFTPTQHSPLFEKSVINRLEGTQHTPSLLYRQKNMQSQ